MAEGSYYDPYYDHNLDDDDDSDQEVNTTRPFQPTPYHRGEQHEMQTMHHKQSGLPDTSYEETPLLGDFLQPEDKQTKIEKFKEFIKAKRPRVDFNKLVIGFSKKGTQSDIVVFGPKGGEQKILKSDGSFQKSFTSRYSSILGSTAEEIIAEDRDTILEQRQRLEEAKRQQREAEKIAAENEKEEQDVQNLSSKLIERMSRLSPLKENTAEAEHRRLKLLKKNYETDLKTRKKKWLRLKNKQETKKRHKKRLTENMQGSLK